MMRFSFQGTRTSRSVPREGDEAACHRRGQSCCSPPDTFQSLEPLSHSITANRPTNRAPASRASGLAPSSGADIQVT